METILITGGTGFIGSHTSISLLNAGYKILIIDSLVNSSLMALDRVSTICNLNKEEILKRIKFINGDIRNREVLDKLFFEAKKNKNPISSVIHLAGLKSIQESLQNPISYWESNVFGTVNLLRIMQKYECYQIVFSSSASIYGFSKSSYVDENSNLNPINPYAKTKVAIEDILNQLFNSSPNKWKIACLRYFNPIGAHPSGLIGENPLGIPNNIFPHLIKVAAGKEKIFKIFGNSWPTNDGTGVRDYIHVMDLAEGHLSALNYLFKEKPQILTLNLGTGKGTSVL